MAKVIMVIGGSRSGKSQFAEKIAKEQHLDVTYIATGTRIDKEFSERIMKHRERRPLDWITIEEPIALHKVLENHRHASEQQHANKKAVCIIDGIGTWIANLMYQDEKHITMNTKFIWNEDKEKECMSYVRLFMQAVEKMTGTIILVADEVGMDVVPEHKEARVFRDLNGMTNQMLAEIAERVYLVVCGLPIPIK